jgi:hypothetical protein
MGTKQDFVKVIFTTSLKFAAEIAEEARRALR